MTGSPNRRELFEVLAGLVVGHQHQLDVDWSSGALWGQLIPLAELHRVTAVLSESVRETRQDQLMPREALAFLDAVHELNLDRNRALEAQCLHVLQILQDADVPAVPLKGLAYQLMGLFACKPGQRMTVDIDILVPTAEAKRAQEALLSVGYTELPAHDTPAHDYHNLPRLKSDPDRHGPGSIEVHFRVGGDEVDALLPAECVMERARPIGVGDQTILIPDPVDLLDHAVIHSGISHGYASRRTLRLRDAVDITKLWALVCANGHSVEDLKIQRHDLALRYFGACLLLAGTPKEDLGVIEPAAAGLLKQILWRQAVRERSMLESSLIANVQLVAQEPKRLVKKLLRGRFYKAAKTALKSPTV